MTYCIDLHPEQTSSQHVCATRIELTACVLIRASEELIHAVPSRGNYTSTCWNYCSKVVTLFQGSCSYFVEALLCLSFHLGFDTLCWVQMQCKSTKALMGVAEVIDPAPIASVSVTPLNTYVADDSKKAEHRIRKCSH